MKRTAIATGYIFTQEIDVSTKNWKNLIIMYEHLIGGQYKDEDGEIYTFFGLVHTEEDYYFGMTAQGGIKLISCVATPEMAGLKRI